MTEPLRPLELLERLVAAEVRFVVVGGLAVNAWGYLRATQDVDIVPDPAAANLDRLADLLEALDGRVEAAEGRLAASAIRVFLKAGDRTLVSTTAGPIDVLQGLPQVPSYSRLETDAATVQVGGIAVRVCSLGALLEMKRASTRARDRDDVEALEAAQGEPSD